MTPWQQMSGFGISFNNDAIGLQTGVAQTRLNMEQWGGVMKTANLGMTAFGGTMSDGARMVSSFAAEFANTDATDKLQAMGYTAEETAQVLALSLVGKKRFDVEDRDAKVAAMKAAEDLATEMDAVAKLTGVSRKEQQTALDASMHNARTRIAVEQAVAAGGEGARDAYKNMNAEMTGIGLKDFADNIYAGNAKTKETIDIQNALGPAGTQLESAINATKNAQTEGERSAAKLAVQQAQAAVSARMAESSFQSLVKTGLGPVSDAAGKLYLSTMNQTDAIEAVKKAEFDKTGKVLTNEEALAAAKLKIANEQNGIGVNGKVDGAETTKVLTQGMRLVGDQQAALAKQLGILNTNLGSSGLVKGAIKATKNVKKDEKTGKENSAMDRSPITTGGELIQDFIKDPKKTFDKTVEAATVKAKELYVDGAHVTKLIVDGAADGLNVPKPFNEPAKKPDEMPKEATGSKDVWGDWFSGPRNSPSLLRENEPEATVPQSKLSEFMKDMMPDITEMLPRMPGQMSSAENAAEIQKNVKAQRARDRAERASLSDHPHAPLDELAMKAQNEARAKMSPQQRAETEKHDKQASLAIEEAINLAQALDKQSKIAIPQDNTPAAIQSRINENQKAFAIGNAGKPANASDALRSGLGEQLKSVQKPPDVAPPPPPPPPPEKPEEKPTETHKASLDDLREELVNLNKSMVKLLSSTIESVNLTSQQVRATKKLSPNMNVR